ncbi:SRPBCC domain-containing protein [Taibaiella lutea]|uniref:SRPBCC domain-containing protein n=1 Tax=Taibaiella lutea TaxID=2608001 RepID=A0A5M6CT19_9BACT|nr:SRPBCC domain-containing protein [Taibaiella lutea]KAA5537102.1 SRPBCC domain-containing protein [Taibaiella lutea]
MGNLHFEIAIQAPVEKVYNTMLADESYRKWTNPFFPGSYYKGSWDKGAKILFLAPGEQGEGGMVSRIKENIPEQFVSIEHLGMLKDGKEITSGPEVDSWAGALENYTFESVDGGTLLKIDMHGGEDPNMTQYFNDTWPKALEILKKLCE